MLIFLHNPECQKHFFLISLPLTPRPFFFHQKAEFSHNPSTLAERQEGFKEIPQYKSARLELQWGELAALQYTSARQLLLQWWNHTGRSSRTSRGEKKVGHEPNPPTLHEVEVVYVHVCAFAFFFFFSTATRLSISSEDSCLYLYQEIIPIISFIAWAAVQRAACCYPSLGCLRFGTAGLQGCRDGGVSGLCGAQGGERSFCVLLICLYRSAGFCLCSTCHGVPVGGTQEQKEN